MVEKSAIITAGVAGGMLRVMAPPRQPKLVFLSHTSELQQWPADWSFVDAARDAVNEAGNVPVDMKHFTAYPQPPAQVGQQAVRSTDVFVGIVGFRYGSPVRDSPELSYTELEFQEASKADITRLMFLLDKKTEVPADLFVDIEYGERQQKFRNSLSDSGITIRPVTSPDNLQDDQERNTAVARTIGVSLSRLTEQQRARYLELAVFRKDVSIPVPVLARYFTATAATAEWSESQTRRYCHRLAALALVSNYHRDQVKLHNIIHAYLHELAQDRRGELHRALIECSPWSDPGGRRKECVVATDP